MTSSKIEDFAARGAEIRRAYRGAERAQAVKKRRGEPGLRPAETPEGILYFKCYRYFRSLKKEGKLDALAQHLSGDRHSNWRRHQRNGIENVLRLIEQRPKPWIITPSRRGRIVKELSFADANSIHPKLLLAFLYEAGPHSCIALEAEAEADAPEAWILHYKSLSKLLRQWSRKATLPDAAAPPE